jgi:hypothetical protein
MGTYSGVLFFVSERFLLQLLFAMDIDRSSMPGVIKLRNIPFSTGNLCSYECEQVMSLKDEQNLGTLGTAVCLGNNSPFRARLSRLP